MFKVYLNFVVSYGFRVFLYLWYPDKVIEKQLSEFHNCVKVETI